MPRAAGIEFGTRCAACQRRPRAFDAFFDRGGDIGRIKRRSGIENDDFVRRAVVLAVKHRQQDFPGCSHAVDTQITAGSHVQAKVLRVNFVLADFTALEFAD